MKFSALLLFILIQQSTAVYYISGCNDAKTKSFNFELGSGRECICLSETQTSIIYGSKGGIVRAFSSTDCTGNYDVITTSLSSAQWVNSISFGQSGSSTSPPPCVNYDVIDGCSFSTWGYSP